MKVVELGTTIELEAEITNTKTGEAVDVEEDLFKIMRPNGELDSPSVEHLAKGKYLCFYDPIEEEVHNFLFLGKGENKVAGEGAFRVRKPRVPHG